MAESVTVSDDSALLDRDWVWRMLSTQAYWNVWRSRDEAQIESAWRIVGAYGPDGRQIRFARAVSDGVAFAYLADVIVDPAARGRGTGKALLRCMIDDGPGAAFRWTLFTPRRARPVCALRLRGSRRDGHGAPPRRLAIT